MNIVKVRNVEIGNGVPKICVPIVGITEKDILISAQKIASQEVDLVEWRADWFDGLLDKERVKKVLENLRKTLRDIPILFTIRTKAEGGQVEILPELYEQINVEIARTGYVDMLDIEVFMKDLNVHKMVEDIKKEAVITVGSNHDFEKTPPKDEIIRRLCFMQKEHLDILKIAVMPLCEEDVLALLDATLTMKKQYAKQPLITMSMGKIGMISRISGGVFGSSVTFGTIGEASAPGQPSADRLKHILNDLN